MDNVPEMRLDNGSRAIGSTHHQQPCADHLRLKNSIMVVKVIFPISNSATALSSRGW